MKEVVHVGMADYKICHKPQKISTLGLGSCLGVVLYDRAAGICGLAHVMMPDSKKISKDSNRKKFADTCLSDMYAELLRAGAKQKDLVAKLAGGARMFSYHSGQYSLNIGDQNVAAVHTLLEQWKIPIVAEDVGKNYGRTIEFDTETGVLHIKGVGIGESTI